MKALNAIILSVALSCTASAFAGENVKSEGGDVSKFGRTVEEDSVKAGGGDVNKFGRAVEEDTVKAGGGDTSKFGRTVEDSTGTN